MSALNRMKNLLLLLAAHNPRFDPNCFTYAWVRSAGCHLPREGEGDGKKAAPPAKGLQEVE